MEERIIFLEKEIKKMGEQLKTLNENLVNLGANYKAFRDSTEKKLIGMDEDSRNFERGTCELGEEIQEAFNNSEEDKYANIIESILKQDLTGREKNLLDEIDKRIPTEIKSGGNFLQIVNFILLICIIAYLVCENFI